MENRFLRILVPKDRFRLPGALFYDPSGKRRFDEAKAVMSEGRIVEAGTHADLLAGNSLYAGLYRFQFSRQVG